MEIGALNPSRETSFYRYILRQKRLLLVWVGVAVLQFALLKFFFPYPDFFSDSYTYVKDAIYNIGFGVRPQGYPQFLFFLHSLLPTVGFVVFVQYLLFLLSTLLCSLSCGYLFGLTKKQSRYTLGIILLNPMLVLLTNLVSSDSLFCSLTVLWFTALLWIIKKPGWLNLIIHALLLLACLHVRYTGLFYLCVSVIAFIAARGKILFRIAGIALSISMIYGYVTWQENQMDRIFNVRIFSAFSNWQIANNALCYYKKLNIQASDMPNRKDSIIDLCVKKWIDNVYDGDHLGTQYMWDKNSPLKIYITLHARFEDERYFSEWIWCSKDIGDYGWALIKWDPWAYVRYFMVPNFRNFMVPDLEAVEDYNIYNLPVTSESKDWYELDTDILSPRFPQFEQKLMFVFPYLNCLLNLLNILFIFYFFFRNFKHRALLRADIHSLYILWSTFYIGFLVFSVASAYIVFRYLDIIFILGIIIPVILYGHSYKSYWPSTPEAIPDTTGKSKSAK